MGSKSKILGFVLEGINEVYEGGVICDLFAGSASLAGVIGDQASLHSNDIQNYSAVLAKAYLSSYQYEGMPTLEELIKAAETIVEKNKAEAGINFSYHSVQNLSEFQQIEAQQLAFINCSFSRDWHLFFKYYSGTWWSAEQCLWIDALRQVAEGYVATPSYELILAVLMYAMAYTSQGTGHYAQYRDATTESSMKDILLYRKRSVKSYFEKKWTSIKEFVPSGPPVHAHRFSSLDFEECLNQLTEGGTVYADPPYCFVHYSRFYHALETLVLYDYPAIQMKDERYVKGRYRVGRHQSPFSIKSQVRSSFEALFKGVMKSNSNLVLSYSKTGLIDIDELGEIALQQCPDRRIQLLTTDHQHMTLGRKNDRHREVQECLLLIQ